MVVRARSGAAGLLTGWEAGGLRAFGARGRGVEECAGVPFAGRGETPRGVVRVRALAGAALMDCRLGAAGRVAGFAASRDFAAYLDASACPFGLTDAVF